MDTNNIGNIIDFIDGYEQTIDFFNKKIIFGNFISKYREHDIILYFEFDFSIYKLPLKSKIYLANINYCPENKLLVDAILKFIGDAMNVNGNIYIRYFINDKINVVKIISFNPDGDIIDCESKDGQRVFINRNSNWSYANEFEINKYWGEIK